MRQTNDNTNELEIGNINTKYMHLSKSERIKIQQLYTAGYSFSKIGKSLSRSTSTISREIKRNSKMNQPSIANIRLKRKKYRYTANNAQKIRDNRFNKPKNQTKFNFFITYCNTNIKYHTTLEELLATFNKQNPTSDSPTLKTVYNWTHKGLITYSWGGKPIKRQRPSKNRTYFNDKDKKTIHQRTENFNFELNDLSHRKHFEIDTIYNGDKKGGVLTLNERATRMLYAIQIPDRKASTINKNLRILLRKIGADNILSITSDNGSEFSFSAVIENSFDLKWYYCDPYSSWQRGQNERLNRDIRKFYRKGELLTQIPLADFDKTIEIINSKPRRVLNYLSSLEYINIDKNNK